MNLAANWNLKYIIPASAAFDFKQVVHVGPADRLFRFVISTYSVFKSTRARCSAIHLYATLLAMTSRRANEIALW
jgi:hypothetical protein